MKALVYHGPGQKSWESAQDPSPAEPTDIVVRIDTTTICGTDLHILKGDVPAVTDGRILGHEAVGTVVAVGSAVTSLAEGDRVLVPAITSCGRCSYCKRAMPSHCQAAGGIGWIFGHLIDGTQAEYTRVPFAETSVHKVPDGVSDEQVLFLADILPTGYEVGVRNGQVKPGDVVVVVGAGPVGLAAIQTASLSGAATIVAVEPAESRREHARRFGADVTIDPANPDAEQEILALTDGGLGADVTIEAVGVPATFDMCTRVVRPGGVVANIGVHGVPTTLHLEELWIKNVTITTGLVDGTTVPLLLQLVRSGKIAAEMFGTHEFGLHDMLAAYDTFAEAGKHNALKVVIRK
ncbi:MAG TPA: alcohol dehydrogenase catalytic domain-containing protein [Streptosporangiaceae bacterium]